MSKAFARGACPGLSAPMETGDGLLARLVAAGPCRSMRSSASATPRACTATASWRSARAAACRCAGSTPRLGAAVRRGGRSPRYRSLRERAGALRSAARRSHRSDRFAGDRRGAAPSHRRGRAGARAESLRGDRRRRAHRSRRAFPPISGCAPPRRSEGPRLHVALAGDASSATEVGVIAPQDAVDAVLALLSTIAATGIEARAADLLPPRDARRCREPGSSLAPQTDRAASAESWRMRSRRWPCLRPCRSRRPEGACRVGHGARRALGAAGSRPCVLLGPLSETNATAMSREAERLGFVTDANDPRRRIVACPGAPACASGLIAARSLAAEIARDVPLLGEGLALHVSGCAKGCAHPAPAPLTIVGTEQGCGIIANDTARATPSTYLDAKPSSSPMLRGKPSQKRRGRQCLSPRLSSATAPPSMSAPSPSSAPKPICRASPPTKPRSPCA